MQQHCSIITAVYAFISILIAFDTMQYSNDCILVSLWVFFTAIILFTYCLICCTSGEYTTQCSVTYVTVTSALSSALGWFTIFNTVHCYNAAKPFLYLSMIFFNAILIFMLLGYICEGHSTEERNQLAERNESPIVADARIDDAPWAVVVVVMQQD